MRLPGGHVQASAASGQTGGCLAQVALPAPGSRPPAQGPGPRRGWSHRPHVPAVSPLSSATEAGAQLNTCSHQCSTCSPAGKQKDVSTIADRYEQHWKRTTLLLCTRSLFPHKQTPRRTLGARSLAGSGVLRQWPACPWRQPPRPASVPTGARGEQCGLPPTPRAGMLLTTQPPQRLPPGRQRHGQEALGRGPKTFWGLSLFCSCFPFSPKLHACYFGDVTVTGKINAGNISTETFPKRSADGMLHADKQGDTIQL